MTRSQWTSREISRRSSTSFTREHLWTHDHMLSRDLSVQRRSCSSASSIHWRRPLRSEDCVSQNVFYYIFIGSLVVLAIVFSISRDFSGCAISWSQRSDGHPKEDDSGLQIIDDSGKLPDLNLVSSKSGFGTSWLQNAATSSSVSSC